MFRIAALLVLAGVALSSPSKNSQVPRRYDPTENDPLRISYLLYNDKDGNLRLENLRIVPKSIRATASDVNLYLYTRSNLNNPELIRCDNFNTMINSVYFNPARENFFITHGWNNDYTSEVGQSLKNALIPKYDLNVFVVDWSGPANEFYTGAQAAVDDIGFYLGLHINSMMDQYGLTPNSFSMAGHSLGAHVSGNAGATVNGLVKYIIGMDPAGPLFTLGNTDNRIDPSDAAYVQIVHSNGGLLGFMSAIGHSDFYPNGGDWQPGCGIDVTGACAHSRSYQYVEESIILSSGFTSTKCDSYDNFEAGVCSGNPTSYLGRFFVDTGAFGDFYLNTHSEAPYSMS